MGVRTFSKMLRWVPALLTMAAIFSLSSLPARSIPHFGDLDLLIKKASHFVGYALLGISYYFALPSRLSIGYRWIVALLMAVLFALSDEYHQSFVEGRTSSLTDVAIDSVGAAISLTAGAIYSSNSSSKLSA